MLLVISSFLINASEKSFDGRIVATTSVCVVIKLVKEDFEISNSIESQLKMFFQEYNSDESSKKFLNNDFESYKEKFRLDNNYDEESSDNRFLQGLYGFFLKYNQRLVGLCDLELGNDSYIEICRMVHPDYRSNGLCKLRIGASMYKFLCDQLKYCNDKPYIAESYIDITNSASLAGMVKYGLQYGFNEGEELCIPQENIVYRKFICTKDLVQEKLKI